MTVDQTGIVKPTPTDLMEDAGTGLDYGTRLDRMLGDITPVDRFFIRSHAPTPRIDVASWELHVDGDGVRRQITFTYDDLCTRFPLTSMVRTIECAGNRRVGFGAELGQTFDGTQWGRGAISTAEWTGVRLRDLLEPAGITSAACEVLAESLDEIRGRRPLPLPKARADDTIVAIAMNGEPLPPDHGFPGLLAALAVRRWQRLQTAMRRHADLPTSRLPAILGAALLAMTALLLVLLFVAPSAGR